MGLEEMDDEEDDDDQRKKKRRRIDRCDDDDLARRTRNKRNDNEMSLRLLSQIVSLRKEVKEMRLEAARRHEMNQQSHNTHRKNIAALMRNPTRNFSGSRPTIRSRELDDAIAEEETPEANYIAILGRCPKTLHTLWREWEFGSPGNKAARFFNASERGKREVKYNFSKRKPLWMLVNDMVKRGHTAVAACTLIHDVHGDTLSVSAVLAKIRKDKGNHSHLQSTVN